MMYESIDVEKLELAIEFVDQLAGGCNPVNGMPIEEGEIYNDPNIIRCMYFIKDVLTAVRRNNGVIGGRRTKPAPEWFPVKVLDEFQYREDKSITHLLKQIYEPVQELNVKKISVGKVTSWLKEEGYLEEVQITGKGKMRNVPTEKGEELGLYVREREFNGRTYESVIYDRRAQEYVVEMIRKKMEKNLF